MFPQAEEQFQKTKDRLMVLAVAPGGRLQVVYADPDPPVQAIADVLAEESLAAKTMSAYKSKVVRLNRSEWIDIAKRGLGED